MVNLAPQKLSNEASLGKVYIQISLSHRYRYLFIMYMHTCIINKRSIDPRLNHQRFRYHITRLKKTREEQLMVFFFFLYSELFYVTTGERQIYKDFTNKKLKITIKSIYIFMFVLHNPFKTNVQEKFKIFKYSHHMMLLNWKQFI